MISLLVGFMLGGLVIGGAVWFYMRWQTSALRNEHQLLASRVRSFLALLDSGLLESRHPEVRSMLVETRSMIDESPVAGATEVATSAVTGERQDEDDESDVPSILVRAHQVVNPQEATAGSEPDGTRDE